VRLDDPFWAPRIETNRQVSIPFAFQQCERSGRMDNFVRAATALRGAPLSNKQPPGYPFDDTDAYKVIEGAAYSLSVTPDAKLEAYVDDLVGKIAAAQEPDGYLYTTRSIDPLHPHPWAGPQRWTLEKVDSHELYNLGHLYEAAVAYYQATGKRRLLDVALKTADLLVATFGPGKRAIWPGHQITEMGLVKLYRVTGAQKYLDLAKFMLDVRGPDGDEGAGRQYNQSHQPVAEQAAAVGHAVRATYMYSGMADVAALTGDRSYLKASDAIWQDVVGKKIYITGGIGATGDGEAFGGDYDLPNMTAYNETCASIGNDYWNHRLFLLHAEAKYIDVMERTLYNGLISGVSLDGKSFFYPNPLESVGQHARSPWFGVACCPSNITRFLASVPGYVYATQGRTLFVNLYVAGTATVDGLGAGGTPVRIVQDTKYPWDGLVRITLEPRAPGRFDVKVRIPGWARGEVVPSALYRFLEPVTAGPVIKVNGAAVPVTIERGYVTIAREWQKGDTIAIDFEMPVRRIVANDLVEANRGRVALQRGPVVFAIEWPDNEGSRVRNLVLPDGSELRSEFRPDLLGGVQVVRAKGVGLSYDAQGRVTRAERTLTAIPYALWANRGRGEMAVWLARTADAAKPAPFPTIATTGTVTASESRRYPGVINDGVEPSASDDAAAHFDWWPKRGTSEWVELAFRQPATVSHVDVYWFDDAPHGRARVPASWRLLYKDGESWKPVTAAGPYGVEKDRDNGVDFAPVRATALRIELTLQPEFTAGVQEWKVR
jgi:hypothetical protein